MVCTSLPQRLLPSAILFASLFSANLPVASAQPRSRIAAPLTASSAIAIPHSVQPRAKLGADLGPTSPNTLLRGMSIRFNMTDTQKAALDQLLSDLQDPSSPRYHQWLTPAGYGAQFGMSSADLAKVSAWLTARGFTVNGVANGGTFISFDGTVAQAEAAFATSIHNIQLNNETHFANMTDVSLPSAFAGTVAAVTGLHNFRPEPRSHPAVVKPAFTSSLTGNHYIAPGDLYTIYNMTPLMANYTGGGIGLGTNCHSAPSGTTCGDIAVTGRVDINAADIAAFRSASGLSANPPTTQVVPAAIYGGCDPGTPTLPNRVCVGSFPPGTGDLKESSIDVEWSGAMAPSATVLFVTSQDSSISMTYAIDANVAPIVTTSYGLCEAGWGSTEMNILNAVFKQANAQGQTVIAASADQGATDCDAGPTATQGLAVDFPGSSPNVTSMGGTMFNDTGATQYWNSNSSGTVANAGSAISYIPEAVWNDGGFAAYGGGGGGASAFFPKPAWQQQAAGVNASVPADGSRDVPDISLNASDAHDSLLLCVNVAAGTSCGSGFRTSTTNTGLDAEGGTSFDSQIFGGMLALIEQKVGSRFGNINPTVYALANNSAYYTAGKNTLTLPTVVFNDVTTGNNAQLCLTGSPNCGNGGTAGFSAGLGYDLATGWGSVNLANLANAWTHVTPLGIGSLGAGTSATTLTASATTAVLGATVTLTATVTGTGATPPTGVVQFYANSVALGSPVALPANGIAVYPWVTTCAALGQQVLSAAYSGDLGYQGSKGPALVAAGGTQTSNGSVQTSPVQVVVTSSTCPDYSIAASTPAVSVAAGGTIPPVTITTTPVNGFAGTVTFTAVATSTSGFAPTLTFSTVSLNVTSSAPVTTSLAMSGITASLHLPGLPGQVGSGTLRAQHTAPTVPWSAAASGVSVASLLLLLSPRRRRLGGLLIAILGVALIGGITGCGSSQSGPPATTTVPTNPYVGTYNVTVVAQYTGTSNQVTQHSTVIAYTIN